MIIVWPGAFSKKTGGISGTGQQIVTALFLEYSTYPDSKINA